MGLIGTAGIEFAQPAPSVVGPGVEVGQCGFWESLLAMVFAQGKQLILQRLDQIGLGHDPHIGGDEHPVQKTRHQRRVIRAQQPPGRVILAQQLKSGVVEGHVFTCFSGAPG